MECRRCQTLLPRGSRYCPHCGSRHKRRVPAWVEAIVLFYTGSLLAGLAMAAVAYLTGQL